MSLFVLFSIKKFPWGKYFTKVKLRTKKIQVNYFTKGKYFTKVKLKKDKKNSGDNYLVP